MRTLIADLGRKLPPWIKHGVIGSPSDPTWLANVIHSLLDRVPGNRFPVLPCGGVLDGYRMKIDWTRHRGFVYGTWEPSVVKALLEAVSLGDVAIDIGAHIGFYTLLLSKLVGPGGLVIAFEPLPPNFDVLEENLRLNACSHARAVNKAVLDHAGSLDVTVPRAEPLPGSISLFVDYGGERFKVAAVSLDEFLADLERPIDFIKMDVEGAEDLVLQGARRILHQHHPTMIIELHHADLRRDEHPAIAVLREYGYEFDWLDRWPLTSHIIAKWTGLQAKRRA